MPAASGSMRRLIRQHRRGLAVDTVETAAAALAVARQRAPDLVIADLRMPDTCGYAATWQLREALGRPALPAIAAAGRPAP